MNPRLARWISILLHPVWMPLYALFILFQLNPYLLVTVSDQLQWTIFAIVILDTIVIPLFITYMLFSKGWVRTITAASPMPRGCSAMSIIRLS